ncbi:MAG: condensation domain-containing protein, partial [Gammaproteobacteria bacterium]
MKTESQSIQKTKPSNKKKNIEAIYPLSPLQQGLLFHSTLDPKSGAYIEQLECVLSGNPDISNFHQAWQQTVDQHPVLRTGFFTKTAEKPVQIVSRQVNLPIDIQDWCNLSIEEQNQQWKKLLAEDRRRGFKLSTPPLMRQSLVRLAEDSYRFLWSHHHILLDGWSLALVLKEVLSRYESLCNGRDLHVQPPRSYRDYIAWLQHQDINAAEQYWREQLAGFTAPTPLTVDRDLSNQPSGYAEETLQLSTENTTALQTLAKQQQLTLNTLVQGAWALLLSKYSGEQDIVFGVTTAGRPTELIGVESMVGLFINTLPVRVKSAPDIRLPDWLKNLQTQNANLRQYDYTPLVEVQRWSDVPGGTPLFESIFAFENYPLDSALREQNSGSIEIQ